MAEAKNSFLKSKMNKDLDDRILPNGEYRDALNISVGRSEDDDVGSLENIRGNKEIVAANTKNVNLKCIGKFEDESGNRIFQILTDYADPNPEGSSITYPTDSDVVDMRITMYDFNTLTYTTLIQGKFLNLATNKAWQITGITLLENLLFWTDNRNQPRKINVETARLSPGYYTEENQISVAKYMPTLPPQLYKEVKTVVTNISSTTVIRLNTVIGISVGMLVVSNAKDNVSGNLIAGSEYIKVIAVDTATNTVTLNVAPNGIIVVDQSIRFIQTTMTNESSDPTWPGDPSYLEDKYVRFSYRFQFDDGEYSLMAPFTQIAFIPQQAGFFVRGDEQQAYESSIIKWFENNVDNIKLRILLPDVGTDTTKGGSVSKNIITEYKIREIDLLYKESDSLVVKVLKSIDAITMAGDMDENVYIYEYQSEKPYKTLTEAQTVRVYDKVPVRALAQDVAGNRVIYGNFRDKHTPYSTLNYNCTVQSKIDLYTSFAEYPNSTLKQNRTYQIGWVLADKYGRQSSVILSQYDTTSAGTSSLLFGGSTVYHSYYDANDSLDVKTWFGDAALVLLNETIGNFTVGSTDRNLATGSPGLYGEPKARWVVDNSTNDSLTVNANGIWDLTFSTPTIGTLPTTNDYLRGEFVDYTKIINISSTAGVTLIQTADKPNLYYLYLFENTNLDTKFAYSINPLGWYSYKIVVKQREQDYYNAFLPGFLDGYPSTMTQGSQVNYITTGATPVDSYAQLENGINQVLFPGGELNNTAHTVLLNDNINKIPRDLQEVGPDQTQYRSSVELFGRVENSAENFNITDFQWAGGTGAGASNVRSISFSGPNDPITNTNVFNAPNPNPKSAPIEPGMGLILAPYQIANPATSQDPQYFSKATLITNVVYDSASNTTTVTFAPGGAIPGFADNIIIEYSDNKQYYPLKKADIASTIGTADDLSFYQFSVDNFNGSAAKNLYQLETNPIVARFSTNKKIGTLADDMIPWLSIYETAPVDSLLDIFWETATGWNYISDINQDVEAGSDNPIGFSDRDFTFIENQNFDGLDDNILTGTTGATDSPWITDIFYPVNNTGVFLTNTTVSLFQVTNFDGPNGTDVTLDFELVQVPQSSVDRPGGYRIKFVLKNHAFLTTANTVERFRFSLSIDYNGTTTTRSFEERLANFTPSFTSACPFFETTGQTNTGTIVDLSAVNGTELISDESFDLFFSIVSGNDDDYFVLDSNTGIITLSQTLGTAPVYGEFVPLGVYPLVVKVSDATDINGTLTTSTDLRYQSQDATCLITITVGPEQVPPYYQGPITDEDDFIYAQSCVSGTMVTANQIGGFYFGPDPLVSGSLPNAPITCDVTYVVGGGLNQGLNPTAFDSGVLLLYAKIENAMTCNPTLDNINSTFVENFDIYQRPASATSPNLNNWTLVSDWNGGVLLPGTSSTNNPDNGSGLGVTTSLAATVNSGLSQNFGNTGSRTAFKYISGDDLPGEYFVVLKAKYNNQLGGQTCGCNASPGGAGPNGDAQGYVTFTIEDAYYNGWTEDPSNPGAYVQDSGVPLSYEYVVSTVGGTSDNIIGYGPPSATEQVYAQAKYGGNVRQFFTDATLLTPWNPQTVDPAGPRYHTFAGVNTPGSSQGGNWNVLTPPTPGAWSNIASPRQPFYMNQVSTPYFLAKFDDITGTVIPGFTVPAGYPASSGALVKTAQSAWPGYPGVTDTAGEVPCPIYNQIAYL